MIIHQCPGSTRITLERQLEANTPKLAAATTKFNDLDKEMKALEAERDREWRHFRIYSEQANTGKPTSEGLRSGEPGASVGNHINAQLARERAEAAEKKIAV